MPATSVRTESSADGPLSRDTCFEILSNQRRRFTLHYLKWTDADRVPIHEIIEHITRWEQDTSSDTLSHADRHSVQTAMQQHHLPKMAAEGFIEYDSTANEVALTPAAANTDFYIEAVPSRGIPWGEYYVGMTAITIAGLGGVAFNIFPFTAFTPLMWSIFVITMFLTSSLVHVYDTRYKMRLGARKTPTEVTKG